MDFLYVCYTSIKSLVKKVDAYGVCDHPRIACKICMYVLIHIFLERGSIAFISSSKLISPLAHGSPHPQLFPSPSCFSDHPGPSTHCGSVLFQHRLAWALARTSWRNQKSGISTSLHEAWRMVPMCISPSFPSPFLPIVFRPALCSSLEISFKKKNPTISKRAYFYQFRILKVAKIEGTLMRPKFFYWHFPERFCKDCKKSFLCRRYQLE